MKEGFLIGIDGGGTKTKGAITDLPGSILSEKQTGSTNVHIVGYEVAARRLWNLIRELANQADGRLSAVSVVVAGVAGMGCPSDRKAYLATLKRVAGKVRFSWRKVQVRTDAEIALAGAFLGSPGIVVIAGTGSIVIGKDERGDMHRVGGWGREFGDEGGGFQLGRKALAAVAKASDGRSGPTALTDALLQRLKLTDVSGLVEKVSRNTLDVSTLAPLVLEAAEQGDKVAKEIVKQSADELIDHVRALISKIQIKRKVDVAFIGGLIDQPNVYSNLLENKLSSVLPQVNVRPPLSNPVRGAIYLGLRHLEEKRFPAK